MVLGDLTRVADVNGDHPASTYAPQYTQGGWITMPAVPLADALAVDSPARRLIGYTTATARHELNWLSLDGLLRDQLPPLEDLILGAQPGPIGSSSAVAVIIGGLFLLYRGVIDFRIPLFLSLAAFAALFVLPIPLVIKEAGVDWRWLAMRQPGVQRGGRPQFRLLRNARRPPAVDGLLPGHQPRRPADAPTGAGDLRGHPGRRQRGGATLPLRLPRPLSCPVGRELVDAPV